VLGIVAEDTHQHGLTFAFLSPVIGVKKEAIESDEEKRIR
jgi:hypothetical protein